MFERIMVGGAIIEIKSAQSNAPLRGVGTFCRALWPSFVGNFVGNFVELLVNASTECSPITGSKFMRRRSLLPLVPKRFLLPGVNGTRSLSIFARHQRASC